MRFSAAFVLVALFLPGECTSYARSPAEDRTLGKASTLVTRGARALMTGNLRKAEKQYSRALAIVPELPEGHLGLGHIRMQRREFAEALSAYRRAEACYMRNSANLLEYHRRRYDDAQMQATDIQRRVFMMGLNMEFLETVAGPGNPGTTAQRFEMRNVREDLRNSQGEVERLRAVPPPPEKSEEGVPGAVYFFIGNALLRLQRLDQAVYAWERCAELEPSSPLVHNNLAVGYWKLGRLDRAVSSLEKAETLGFEVNTRFKADLQRSVSDRERQAAAKRNLPAE